MSRDTTTPTAASILDARKSRYATVAFVDLQGQLRGKTVSAAKLSDTAHVPFAPFNHMLDFGDFALMPSGYLSADLAIEDNPCSLVVDTPRTLPFEDKDSNVLFFVEFDAGTQGAGWDPRVAYHRAAQRLTALKLKPVSAFEYEFRLLNETPESAREKGFQNLKLVSEVSTYGGIMRQGMHAAFFRDLRDMCDTMEVPLDSLHWEVAAGMAEVAMAHQQGIKAADDAVLFKTHTKVLAQRNGLLATFMARPMEDADGQGGHLHISLANSRGRNVFFDQKREHAISEQMAQFIAGLETYLPELLLMLAPNVNSFKRFLPGIFAPIAANWGVDNRTCSLRVIEGTAKNQRVEVRTPGSDANPYLVMAAVVGAGSLGIEQELEPSPPMEGSSYLHRKQILERLRFPRTFIESIDRFRNSQAARVLFGEDFVEMFAGTREAQARQFAAMVTNKELERFLELA